MEGIRYSRRVGEKYLEEVSVETYGVTEKSYQISLKHLKHSQTLVSYEILTRGYRIDFDVLTAEELKELTECGI